MSEDREFHVVTWWPIGSVGGVADGQAAARDLAAAEKVAAERSRPAGMQAFVELGDERLQEWRGGYRYDGSVSRALCRAASVFRRRADLLTLSKTEPIAAAARTLFEVEQMLRDYADVLFPTALTLGEVAHMFEGLALLAADTPEETLRVVVSGQVAATLATFGELGAGENDGSVTGALAHGFRAALNDEHLDPQTRERYAAHLAIVAHDIFRRFAK